MMRPEDCNMFSSDLLDISGKSSRSSQGVSVMFCRWCSVLFHILYSALTRLRENISLSSIFTLISFLVSTSSQLLLLTVSLCWARLTLTSLYSLYRLLLEDQQGRDKHHLINIFHVITNDVLVLTDDHMGSVPADLRIDIESSAHSLVCPPSPPASAERRGGR